MERQTQGFSSLLQPLGNLAVAMQLPAQTVGGPPLPGFSRPNDLLSSPVVGRSSGLLGFSEETVGGHCQRPL